MLLADIHSPPGREEPIGICSADLAEALIHPTAEALASFEAIADRALTETAEGDLILVMGPESITPLADRLVARVSKGLDR